MTIRKLDLAAASMFLMPEVQRDSDILDGKDTLCTHI